MSTLIPGITTLHELGLEVAAWHRANWPRSVNALAPIAKVAEEAGELVGAAVKMLEGRSTIAHVRAELGDVVIAAAGAAARLDLLDGDDVLSFDRIVVPRWFEVSARRYGVRA